MPTEHRRLALEAMDRAVSAQGFERHKLIDEALRLNKAAREAELEAHPVDEEPPAPASDE